MQLEPPHTKTTAMSQQTVNACSNGAPSTAPQGVTVDPQSSLFYGSPPPLIDQNGIITKYTVTITEVDSGKRTQQFDVDSTATSVALRDLILIPVTTI